MKEQINESDSIWEKQRKLKEWFDKEYVKEYPGSTFFTGKSLSAKGKRVITWDDLTPEQQERKEKVAYNLNCMLISLGVNISSNFKENKDAE